MTTTERLRALLAEATKRPWRHEPGSGFGTDGAKVWSAQHTLLVEVPTCFDEDARLIAEAINALPALLDVVEAAYMHQRYLHPELRRALAACSGGAMTGLCDNCGAATDPERTHCPVCQELFDDIWSAREELERRRKGRPERAAKTTASRLLDKLQEE
jgi:hypothetical protein